MKCILNINLGAAIGTGATRRYIELFNYISQTSDDVLLILNIDLYNSLKQFNILKTDKNVLVLNVAIKNKLKIVKNIQVTSSTAQGENQNSLIGDFRKTLGKYKYFLKLFIKWIQFSYHFIKIVLKYKIDTVYAIFTGGIWVWPITKLLNIKLIFSSNSYIFDNTIKSKLFFFDSDYWVHKYCDVIDFLSPAMVNTFESKVMIRDKKNYSVSPSSFINLDKFYPVEPKEDWIVFMSRMVAHKNPLLFLNSIKMANSVYPNLLSKKFYLFGDGPLVPDIKQYIKNNNLANVIFRGEIPNVVSFISKSKVFISIQDGNNYPSQSLLEAMACQNAIIASDVGETRRLVSENEGILVPLNAEKIAEALIYLFENPAECDQLGINARKKVIEEHSIEKFAKYFFSIMKNEK